MLPRNVKDVRELMEYARKKNLQDLIVDAKELLDEYDAKQNECNINCEEFTNEVNVSFMEDALFLLACIVDEYDASKNEENIAILFSPQELQVVKYSIVAVSRLFVKTILEKNQRDKEKSKNDLYGKSHDFYSQIELTMYKLGIKNPEDFKKTQEELNEQLNKIAKYE